ncbi:MAG: YgaC family protein [Acidimicrobiia bacterium]|nr:YgaC family protein [Acidimicrobiia bacterium]
MSSQPVKRPEPEGPVVVQYFKYSGDLHWRHDLHYLGEDRHGAWLGGPAGSTIQRGHEPPKLWPSPFVQLVTPGQWWTMFFNGDHSDDFRIYIDVITPGKWVSEDRVEMVDLDLDVVLHHDGTVELLDEDEFLDHSQLFSYPDSLIDGARATAAELMLKVESRAEPFGTDGQAWLAMVQ